MDKVLMYVQWPIIEPVDGDEGYAKWVMAVKEYLDSAMPWMCQQCFGYFYALPGRPVSAIIAVDIEDAYSFDVWCHQCADELRTELW